jgi:hypothetical protein
LLPAEILRCRLLFDFQGDDVEYTEPSRARELHVAAVELYKPGTPSEWRLVKELVCLQHQAEGADLQGEKEHLQERIDAVRGLLEIAKVVA